MRWRTRGASAAVVTGVALTVSASLAFAAASTGWLANNACRELAVDGCTVTQMGSTNYVSAAEKTSCSGDIGLAVRYRPSSTTYTTSVLWAGSSVRWDATNITYLNISH